MTHELLRRVGEAVALRVLDVPRLSVHRQRQVRDVVATYQAAHGVNQTHAAELDAEHVHRAYRANPLYRTASERELLDRVVAAWLKDQGRNPDGPYSETS